MRRKYRTGKSCKTAYTGNLCLYEPLQKAWNRQEREGIEYESHCRKCKKNTVKDVGRHGYQTNMIAPYLYDSIFLDLFAGSGGIGIEALSRGAMEAVFVEKNPKAMACVKENLQKTHFERKGMTMQMDVMTALYKLEGEKQFDYIFMDPPYNHELEKSVLTYLAESSLLAL